MAGKLIVIEGLDGSGKETQTRLLVKRFVEENLPVKAISFPDYKSDSSALVKMYLNGDIGELHEVNVYAATSFYAADRYISYQTQWKKDYLAGVTIVADRYSTANIIYQMAKLPQTQWEEYLNWTWDYEFNKLQLPEPATVIYLDVPPEISRQLIDKRYEGDTSKRDLHEENLEYLLTCRQVALYAAEKLGWIVIPCAKDGHMLPIDEISQRIWNVLL